MAKFGGFGGGFGGGFPGGNMQSIMKQAQKMQQDMADAKDELEETEVEGMSGGGMVKVVLTATKKPVAIKLQKEAVDPDDCEMLEDLILVALTDANEKADKLYNSKMGRFGQMGGMI